MLEPYDFFLNGDMDYKEFKQSFKEEKLEYFVDLYKKYPAEGVNVVPYILEPSQSCINSSILLKQIRKKFFMTLLKNCLFCTYSIPTYLDNSTF
jgi:excinuclease UvrABC helicase subunit UvrB